jgi:hypothetical protein
MPEDENNPWAPGIPGGQGGEGSGAWGTGPGGPAPGAPSGPPGWGGPAPGAPSGASEWGGPTPGGPGGGAERSEPDAPGYGADGPGEPAYSAPGYGAGWPGWPGPGTTTATMPGPEPLAPVLVWVAPPQPQSRGTIAVRLLLAIPHLVVLYALGIASEVLAIIGWFGALFNGQLPDFAAQFLTGFLRWETRVWGYVLLLTDQYPPFTLDDVDYPVRISVRPGRLNRAAVFFRMILIFPAGLFAWMLEWGMGIMSFFMWLITLFGGRLPQAMHEAATAVLRYVTRVYGFTFMLTSAYPGGAFGDQPSTQADDPQLAGWKMVLSSGAKTVLGVCLGLGVLGLGGYFAGVIYLAAHSGGAIDTVLNRGAANTIQTEYGPVGNALNGYGSRATACGQQLSCLTALSQSEVTPLTTFANQLSMVIVAGTTATNAVNTLQTDTRLAASAFSALGSATTPDDYNIRLAQVQQAVTAMNNAYQAVFTALGQNS